MATNGLGLADIIASFSESASRRGPLRPEETRASQDRVTQPNAQQTNLLDMAIASAGGDSPNRGFSDLDRRRTKDRINQGFTTDEPASVDSFIQTFLTKGANQQIPVDTMGTAGMGNKALLDFLESPFVQDTLAAFNPDANIRTAERMSPGQAGFVRSRTDPNTVNLTDVMVNLANEAAEGGQGSESAINFLRDVTSHEFGHTTQAGNINRHTLEGNLGNVAGAGDTQLTRTPEFGASLFAGIIDAAAQGNLSGLQNPNEGVRASTREAFAPHDAEINQQHDINEADFASGSISNEEYGLRLDEIDEADRTGVSKIYADNPILDDPVFNDIVVDSLIRNLDSYPGLENFFSKDNPTQNRATISNLLTKPEMFKGVEGVEEFQQQLLDTVALALYTLGDVPTG